jgi:hypothetical protein
VKKFLHLAVSPIDPGQQALIEEQLNRAGDWLRYLPNCWLIYTSRPAKVWYSRLSSIEGLKNSSNFFICEVDLHNRGGWLKKTVWEWINKDR